MRVKFECILYGKPQPKGNSRQIWRNGKRMRFAPDPKYLAWQDSVEPQINLAKAATLAKLPFKKSVELKAIFYRDRRPDVDNLAKGLFDCLQKYGVLKNDRLVRKCTLEIKTGDKPDRVEFTIVPLYT